MHQVFLLSRPEKLMFGMTRESFVDAVRKWKCYFLILIVLLLLPLKWSFSEQMRSTIILENMFYNLIIADSLSFIFRDVNLLSVVNLILLIIPSIYFTYRRISKFEEESIEGLGVVVFLLSMIVLTIVSSRSLFEPEQIDLMPSPTPNLQYLPGFLLLLLFFTVIVPNLTEKGKTQENSSRTHPEIRRRIHRILPRSSFGWLAALFFILPAQIQLLTTGNLMTGNLRFSGFVITAPFYLFFLHSLRFSGYSDYYITLIFGGDPTHMMLLFGFVWNAILLIFTFLYLTERIQLRLFVLAGIVSIIPNTIYSITTILMHLFTFSSGQIIFILPLLQIGVILILRHERNKQYKTASDVKDIRHPEFVKVPITYLLRSQIRRLFRGSTQGNGVEVSHNKEYIIEEEPL
jgi:hypothetical protein